MALVVATGFETGAISSAGVAGSKVVDVITGTPAIITTSPKSGTYCLEIGQTSATEALGWTTDTLGSSKNRAYAQFYVRFPTSLPTTDVHLASFSKSSGKVAWLTFNAGTNKLAVRHDTDTETDGSSVIADTWYRVEMYVDTSANPHTFNWWVDDVAQTSVTNANAAASIAGFGLGDSVTAQTMTCRYDNLAVYTDTATISAPQGAHKSVLLSADPAGTVTLSGTSTNFNTFYNNNQWLAWNATTARDAVKEVPPLIGSTASGFMQTAVATSDYVEIPLTSYTLGGTETVAGAFLVAVGWSTYHENQGGGRLGIRSWNGSTETVLQPGNSGDPLFGDSTTVPTFLVKALVTADVDTQTELDALCLRVGFSNQTYAYMGIHAAYVEVTVSVPVPVATNVAAQSAAVTATANQAAPKVAPSAGAVSETVTANSATVLTAVNATPTCPAETVTANQAVVLIGVYAVSTCAVVTATANQAKIGLAINTGVPQTLAALVAATANQAAVVTAAVGTAGSAPVTATANQATVVTRTDAMAEYCVVTVAGKDAPMVVQNVWSEGTGTAAVAFSRVGDYVDWLMVLEFMDDMQETDGSLRYMVRPDSLNSLVAYKSVIGAAWNIIAHLENPTQSGTQSGMWGETRPYCVPVPF